MQRSKQRGKQTGGHEQHARQVPKVPPPDEQKVAKRRKSAARPGHKKTGGPESR